MNASRWTWSISSRFLQRVLNAALCAAAVFLAASCTSERAGDPVPPARSDALSAVQTSNGGLALKILPGAPDRKSTLTLVPEGFSLHDARVTWYMDGSPASFAAADLFDCGGVPRGATVRATAVVNGSEVRSNTVTVGNTPPELSHVELVQTKIGQDETLAVTANAADRDDDPVTIQYAWMVNDVLAGNGPKLTRQVVRGDRVRVEVSANDGKDYGERVVLNHTIDNHPPVFVEHQNCSFSGSAYIYQAQATDADGDRITYSLEAPVEGISIDPSSGKVLWNVPAGYHGEQAVTIVANDGHGGTASYRVTFRINE